MLAIHHEFWCVLHLIKMYPTRYKPQWIHIRIHCTVLYIYRAVLHSHVMHHHHHHLHHCSNQLCIKCTGISVLLNRKLSVSIILIPTSLVKRLPGFYVASVQVSDIQIHVNCWTPSVTHTPPETSCNFYGDTSAIELPTLDSEIKACYETLCSTRYS